MMVQQIGRYLNTAKDMVQLTEYVGKKLSDEGIPLEVLHGQEIRIHDELYVQETPH